MTTLYSMHDFASHTLAEGLVTSFVTGNEHAPAPRTTADDSLAASAVADFDAVQRGRLVFTRTSVQHHTAVLSQWGPAMVTLDLALSPGGLSLNGQPRPERTLLVYGDSLSGSSWGGYYEKIAETDVVAPLSRPPHLAVSVPLELWNELGLNFQVQTKGYQLFALSVDQAQTLQLWMQRAIDTEGFHIDNIESLRLALVPLLSSILRSAGPARRVSKYMNLATRGAALSKRINTVHEILQVLGISERTLQRAFQQTFGTCPRYYMSSQRHGELQEHRGFGAQEMAASAE